MVFSWLSLFAGFAYIVFGIAVIIKKWFFIYLDIMAAYALGGLMILYGIFRIIRGIRQIKNKE